LALAVAELSSESVFVCDEDMAAAFGLFQRVFDAPSGASARTRDAQSLVVPSPMG